MSFREIPVTELSFNPFDKIGKEWMLITAGDENGWNTMTASWGFMGVMWRKNILETVIRPSRYTYEFIKKNDMFTASFLGEKYRSALSFCGSHSGRDCDKAEQTGLTPYFTDGTAAISQASLILVCRRIYAQEMLPSLLSEDIRSWYDNGEPPHTAFYGEIIKVLAAED